MDRPARRDRLVSSVLSLPDAAVEPGGDGVEHVGFSVRNKRFGWYLDDHHGDGVIALTCKARPGLNADLVAADPDRYFIPTYTGARGWVGIRLDLETVDWDEIDDLLEDAYRMTAPQTLVRRLDGTDDPRSQS